MANQTLKTINTFKDKVATYVVEGIFALIVAGVLFYFSATATLSAHDEKLKKLETKLENVITIPLIQTEQIKNLNNNLEHIYHEQTTLRESSEQSFKQLNGRIDEWIQNSKTRK